MYKGFGGGRQRPRAPVANGPGSHADFTAVGCWGASCRVSEGGRPERRVSVELGGAAVEGSLSASRELSPAACVGFTRPRSSRREPPAACPGPALMPAERPHLLPGMPAPQKQSRGNDHRCVRFKILFTFASVIKTLDLTFIGHSPEPIHLWVS